MLLKQVIKCLTVHSTSLLNILFLYVIDSGLALNDIVELFSYFRGMFMISHFNGCKQDAHNQSYIMLTAYTRVVFKVAQLYNEFKHVL